MSEEKKSNSDKFREAVNEDMRKRREKWRKETFHRLTQEYFKVILPHIIFTDLHDDNDEDFFYVLHVAECHAELMVNELEKELNK